MENIILNNEAISRILNRISHQILEENKGADNLAIIGIRTCGVYLGRKIRDIISTIEKRDIPFGVLDITLYRDDLNAKKEQPLLRKTEINFSVDGMKIILVDDILFTGRTIRAALDSIIDFGRPASIKLAVLVDRGHRELPIHADFAGIEIPTKHDEKLKLFMGNDITPENERLVKIFEEE